MKYKWNLYINGDEDYFKSFMNKKQFKQIVEIKHIAAFMNVNHANFVAQAKTRAMALVKNEKNYVDAWASNSHESIYALSRFITWIDYKDHDIEWIYRMSGENQLFELIFAYWCSGCNETFMETFFNEFNAFTVNVMLDSSTEKNFWRTINTATRLKNWIDFIELIRYSRHFSESFLFEFFKNVDLHVEWLLHNNNDLKLMSNWGVFENFSLIKLALMFPEYKKSQLILEKIGPKLLNNIDLQYYNDGMHWEQSTSYHNELLEFWLLIMHYQNQANKHLLQKKHIQKIKKMFTVSLAMMQPDGNLPQQGDSDDLNVEYLLHLAAYVFKLKSLPKSVKNEKSLNYWILGEKFIEKLKIIDVKQNNWSFNAFHESGNFFFHSGYDQHSVYWKFRNGPFGSGHGHADALSFCMYAFNQHLLIDLGRYTYDAGAIRNYYRSAKNHNTILVDNTDFTDLIGGWHSANESQNIANKCLTKDNVNFLAGSHDGYLNKGISVLPTRKVVQINDNLFVIADFILNVDNKKHDYTQVFNFARTDVTIKAENVNLLIDQKHVFDLINLSAGTIAGEKNFYSRHYGSYDTGTRITIDYKQNFLKRFNMINVISLHETSQLAPSIKKNFIYNDLGKIISDEIGVSYDITMSDEIITIVFMNAFAKMIKVNSQPLFGKTILIRKKITNKNKIITVLEN